jgi:hypothetical protein
MELIYHRGYRRSEKMLDRDELNTIILFSRGRPYTNSAPALCFLEENFNETKT